MTSSDAATDFKPIIIIYSYYPQDSEEALNFPRSLKFCEDVTTFTVNNLTGIMASKTKFYHICSVFRGFEIRFYDAVAYILKQ